MFNSPFQMRSAHVTEQLRALRVRGVEPNLPADVSNIDTALMVPSNQQRAILSDVNAHSALRDVLYNNNNRGNRGPAIRGEWSLVLAPDHPFVVVVKQKLKKQAHTKNDS